MKRKQHQLKSVWQGLWLCLAGFFLIGNTACNNKNEVHLNTGTSAQEETEGIAFTPILEGDLHWVGGSNGENSTRSERVVQHPDTTYCIPIDIEPLAGNIQGQDTIPQFYLHVEVNDCPTELGTTTSSTRASLYNSNTLQDFALFAYHYKGHAEDESVSVPYPLKKRIKVTKRDNWKTDLLWGKHITEESITRFCAFAPYNAPVDLKAEDGGAGDFLSFHYTVPSNPADQIDLLSADTGRKVWKNEGVHYGTPIPLAFGHILTSLSFSYQADLPNAIIDEISISNIAMSGTYNYGYDNVAGATGGYWESGRESKGSCVVKVNKEHTFSNRGSSATPLINNFLVLPQSLEDNSTISIKGRTPQFNSSTNPTGGFTFSAKIPPHENGRRLWKAGKHYTYTISTSGQFVDSYDIIPSQEQLCFLNNNDGTGNNTQSQHLTIKVDRYRERTPKGSYAKEKINPVPYSANNQDVGHFSVSVSTNPADEAGWLSVRHLGGDNFEVKAKGFLPPMPMDQRVGYIDVNVNGTNQTKRIAVVQGLKTPLSYFAEYNMKRDGTMGNTHDTRILNGYDYLIDFEEARYLFKNGVNLNGKTYYLPTDKEWQAIIGGSREPFFNSVDFSGHGVRELPPVIVTVGGKDYTMSGSFTNDGRIVYASLQYSDPTTNSTSYYIARYEAQNVGLNNPNAHLEVKMAPANTRISIDQVKYHSAWTSSSGVVLRQFPAAGAALTYSTSPDRIGMYGNYWTDGPLFIWEGPSISFTSKSVDFDCAEPTFLFSVRLVARE